jgi:hypothetical protein
MADDTTTTDGPTVETEDDKVAKRKIEPEPTAGKTELTDVISQVENHHSILKSQANTILVVCAFLALLTVAHIRSGKTVTAVAEAVDELTRQVFGDVA